MNILAALCLVVGLVAICSYASMRGLVRVVVLVAALACGYGFLLLAHMIPAII